MRPSSPRSSRISSTTARYSVSSSRVRLGGGVSSGRSSTSTRRRPPASVSAAPIDAAVEAVQRDGADRRRAGGRARATSATVPTLAYSLSWRGTSSTRSSSPDVDGQGDRHVREDDGVLERDRAGALAKRHFLPWFDLVRNFRKCSDCPVVCGRKERGSGQADRQGEFPPEVRLASLRHDDFRRVNGLRLERLVSRAFERRSCAGQARLRRKEPEPYRSTNRSAGIGLGLGPGSADALGDLREDGRPGGVPGVARLRRGCRRARAGRQLDRCGRRRVSPDPGRVRSPRSRSPRS